MADLLPNHRRTAIQTLAWAAKIVFLLIGIASSAVLLGKLAVPYCHALLSSSLPRLWNSALTFLVPHYLFITVHFIIVVIWKLHGNQRPDEETSPDDAHLPAKSPDLDRNPSTEICPEILSTPAVSAETPPAEPLLSSLVDIKKSIEQRPWPPPEKAAHDPPSAAAATADEPDTMDATWKAIVDAGSSPAMRLLKKSDTWEKSDGPSSAAPADSTDENDTMDAMWKAIVSGGSPPPVRPQLKKSDTWERSQSPAPRLERAAAAPEAAAAAEAGREFRKSKTFRESTRSEAPAAVGWRGRDVLVVGNDELFRRVEAFIKLNYDQMRLQRQESEQRFLEMVNAAY